MKIPAINRQTLFASAAIGGAIFLSSAGGAYASSLSINCSTYIGPILVEDICTEGELSEVEAAVNDNYSRILGNDSDIANLDGRVLVNEGAITDLDGRVTTNEGAITDLDGRVTINEGGIASNLAAIGANEARITTNENNIATNTSAIAVNAADISALRGELSSGLAMSNAMEVFLPDPGAQYRLTAGVGYYDGATAYGVTGAGRISGGTALYFGVATDSAFDTVAGKAGISWQW